MTRFGLPLLGLCLASVFACRALAAEFIGLPAFIGTSEMRAHDVSSDGLTVVGLIHGGGSARGFQWQLGQPLPGLLTDLAGGGVDNEAIALSADGTTIVGRGESNFGDEASFWNAGGAPVGLGDLAGGFFSSRANGASANGQQVIGTGHSAMGREAFRWSAAEGMQGLGFLPDGVASEAWDVSGNGQVVVGVSETFHAILGEAFRWNSTEGMVGLGDLAGGDFMSRATAVSSDGSTIVGVSSSGHGQEAFRWTPGGGMQPLGDLVGGAFHSEAYDVSGDGSAVVGAGLTAQATTEAFLWRSGAGMERLEDVLVNEFGLAAELDGWDLLAAEAISESGRVIVGTGIDPTGQIRAWRALLGDLEHRDGDLDGDGELNESDLELLRHAIRLGTPDDRFDFNGDGAVNSDDQDVWVHDLKRTYYGDSDLDGAFGTEDLVAVFVAGQYEDGIPENSSWSTGDWDGDLDFTSSDIIRAFQDGGYEQGPRAATAAVPEPASFWLGLTAASLLIWRHVRRRFA